MITRWELIANRTAQHPNRLKLRIQSSREEALRAMNLLPLDKSPLFATVVKDFNWCVYLQETPENNAHNLQKILEEFFALPNTEAMHSKVPKNFSQSDSNETKLLLPQDGTLESFHVHAGNRLAYAAARAVAVQPGKIYTPWVLIGAENSGKTHLLAAVAREIHAASTHLKICHVDLRNYSKEKNRHAVLPWDDWQQEDVLILEHLEAFPNNEQDRENFLFLLHQFEEKEKQVLLSSRVAVTQLSLGAHVLEILKASFVSRLEAEKMDPAPHQPTPQKTLRESSIKAGSPQENASAPETIDISSEKISLSEPKHIPDAAPSFFADTSDLMTGTPVLEEAETAGTGTPVPQEETPPVTKNRNPATSKEVEALEPLKISTDFSAADTPAAFDIPTAPANPVPVQTAPAEINASFEPPPPAPASFPVLGLEPAPSESAEVPPLELANPPLEAPPDLPPAPPSGPQPIEQMVPPLPDPPPPAPPVLSVLEMPQVEQAAIRPPAAPAIFKTPHAPAPKTAMAGSPILGFCASGQEAMLQTILQKISEWVKKIRIDVAFYLAETVVYPTDPPEEFFSQTMKASHCQWIIFIGNANGKESEIAKNIKTEIGQNAGLTVKGITFIASEDVQKDSIYLNCVLQLSQKLKKGA